MAPLFVYFVKVNLALALLYICYRLLFQNDTFFKLRRITLLGIFLIAFFYQLPDISEWLSGRSSVTDAISYYSSILPKETINVVETDRAGYNWEKIGTIFLLFIYLTGVFVLTIRCIAELINVLRTYSQCRKSRINGIRVCLLPETENPYSFFRWIFIAPKLSNKQLLDEILQHEVTHVRQMHSFDILISEIASIICWMNPFIWLLKKEISINHEYLADQQVVYAGYNKKEYQYHLIGMEHPNTAAANLYNNFSVLPLKKRITMLNKKRTNCVRKVKYLALIPMAFGLLLINNIDAMARLVVEKVKEQVPAVMAEVKAVQPLVTDVTAPIPPDDKIYTICEVMPEFPGGTKELLNFLNKSIKYPEESIKKKEEGRVTLTFVVEKDGSISNVKVVRSVSPLLDAEAVRIINTMPKWSPAKNKDQVVRVNYTLPVIFKLK